MAALLSSHWFGGAGPGGSVIRSLPDGRRLGEEICCRKPQMSQNMQIWLENRGIGKTSKKQKPAGARARPSQRLGIIRERRHIQVLGRAVQGVNEFGSEGLAMLRRVSSRR